MSVLRLPLVTALLALLAACAETPEQPAPPPAPEATSKSSEAIRSQPLRHLAGRNLKPQPTRPLNVRSSCNHRDAVGTRTRLSLQVKNAEVKQFSATIDIPKHGVCRFDARDFTQKAKLPQVLLTARDGSACTVRMWEQGPRTTIAFNSCPTACAGKAFDYLWPILVDTRTGRCS